MVNMYEKYRAVREAFEQSKNAEKVTKGGSKGVTGAIKEKSYIGINDEHRKAASTFLDEAEAGLFAGSKFGNRASLQSHLYQGNLQEAANAEGKTVLGMMGSHAIRGAVGGAAIGGTTESLQGGSFWDGAKSGAFKGAVGWTGYRMGMKATGATSINPFAGKGKGMFSANQQMWNLGSKNAEVSKQAAAILRQREGDGLARGVMNFNNSGA